MTSRSKFYVDTPPVSDPPSQRHSMFVDHSEVDHQQRELSSASSSSSILPSTAGSVDRLNDTKKKKNRFFTLKPKTSFSLRPFFSSTNIPSLSSSSSSSKSTPRRCDSCVQTDGPSLCEQKKKAFGEVGVQTLNASTVDVPVQTSFDEWDDGNHSYGNRRPFFSAAQRPGLARGPSAAYYSNQPFPSALKSAKTVAKDPVGGKYSVVAPLDSSKVLKYAPPGDSSPAVTSQVAAGVSDSAKPSEVVDGSVPLKGSTEEPKSCAAAASPKPLSPVSKVVITSDTTPPINKINIQPIKNSIASTPPSVTNSNPEKDSVCVTNLDSTSKSDTNGKKATSVPEVSVKFVPFTHPIDRPSALKIERADSPVRHSAKIKTVHFDLSDSESSESKNKCVNPTNAKKELESNGLNNNNTISKNIDKDFEDLLRNLDILVDDPIESSEPSTTEKVTSSNSFQSSPLKQTLLSTKLRSAFDILGHDVLPPILETANENSETEPPIPTKTNEKDINELDNSEANSNLHSIAKPVVDILNDKLPSPPTTELNKGENNLKSLKDSSPQSTSVSTFTSTKSDEFARKDGTRENVYDRGVTESVIKTVTLPTLPSFFDSTSKSSLSDLQPVIQERIPSNTSTAPENLLESDHSAEEKMLSRSSSRGSLRSNPTSEFNAFFNSAKKFDSCENLDQLEEEIIRSLCEPGIYNGSGSESDHKAIPVAESPDASQVRRAILDRLLSGENEDGTNSNRSSHVYTPEEMIEIPESKINARQSSKHVATLTKFEHHRSESPLKSNFFAQHNNTNPTNEPLITSSDDINASRSNEESSDQSKITSAYKNESPNKNTLFYFPESKPLNDGVPEKSLRVRDNSSGNLCKSAFEKHENHINEFNSGNNVVPNDTKTETCDFTHCLRPSEIQNSSFLEKIGSQPIPSRSSPERSHSRSESPALFSVPASKVQNNPSGHCDFANCLKPSQVQKSIFTAELSEITANKILGADPLRTNSPLLTSRTNSPTKAPPRKLETDKTPTPNNDVSHKSEMTIVLQTPSSNKTPSKEQAEYTDQPAQDDIIEVPPVYSTKKEPIMDKYPPAQESSSVSININNQNLEAIPPPPPPPPPSTFRQGVSNVSPHASSLQSMLESQHSHLVKPEPAASELKSAPNKSPVMMELEKRFETHRRHSCDELDLRVTDQSNLSKSDIPEIRSNTSPERRHDNGDNSFVFHHSPTATTYQCNGSNGSYSPRRDYATTNGKNENGFNGRAHVYSPTKTIITGDPPPPGAVLVDEKVTVDGDRVHTDKYYAMPVKKVLTETTTTTKFIPAPPKYEGIGPTEDGIPVAPRNSVKKENMHNWYKTMFKSLHKADLSNDNQEYIIGYSSEPETSKKEKASRKKSSTLDNRSGIHNTSKTNDHLSRQPYPASAKSSIDVYNVRPRLIEDYEPGHSSVTDDELTVGYKRYLPALNTPKPSYEYKNGYEQDNNFIRNLSPFDGPDPEQQKVWYKEIQKGGEIPQFGLGKQAPEKPKDPIIGPLPPPPLNYHGPTISQQATRPLTLPASYQNDNGICQQSNGPYEMHMRQVIHSELQQRISPSSSQLSSPSRSILKSPSRSPDLKIPARALFDFKAESTKEISLKKDDVVLILRQLDKNWYEGEHHGRIGIFPISYVEIVPPEHASTPIKSFTHGSGKVLFDFTAHTSVELSVRKGDLVVLLRRVDSNWYEARFNSKKGIIPASYLQVLQEPTEKSISPTPKPCLRSPRSSSETRDGHNKTNLNSLSPSFSNTSPSMIDNDRGKYQSRSKKSSSLIEPVMYKALYSYSPMNSDELEIVEGDTIYVVEMCDDGWFVGTSVRTGVFGIFPGNYVEKAW